MLAYLKQPKKGGYLLSGGVGESEPILELSFLDQNATTYFDSSEELEDRRERKEESKKKQETNTAFFSLVKKP